MKLGIMQPYFFPYAQQFRHINQCNAWIVFDTPRFSRKSWVSRNRIINRSTDWSYISIPVVKGASQLPIYKAKVSQSNWKRNFYDSLKIYENIAPFYNETLDMIKACIEIPFDSIADLNTHILKTICRHLDIRTDIKKLSELSLDIPNTAEPGQWACYISKAYGAKIYSNAPGGRHLFDPEYYKQNNIALEFYEPCSLKYSTPGFNFTPDLSVIDPLMWMGIQSLRNWCNAH